MAAFDGSGSSQLVQLDQVLGGAAMADAAVVPEQKVVFSHDEAPVSEVQRRVDGGNSVVMQIAADNIAFDRRDTLMKLSKALGNALDTLDDYEAVYNSLLGKGEKSVVEGLLPSVMTFGDEVRDIQTLIEEQQYLIRSLLGQIKGFYEGFPQVPEIFRTSAASNDCEVLYGGGAAS